VSTQTVIKAEAMLFSELFHKGKFRVPWHQRYYDWKASDVRALLEDVNEAIKEGRDCYFLGAIMLIEAESRSWEINDGQQRMVTVSLICAALCRRFASEDLDSQREGHALRILFNLPATKTSSLDSAEHYTPRITPPQNDAMRYRQMIRGNTIGTNGMLTTAWKEIEKFFAPISLKEAKKYFDFILGKLEVACLWIPPHIDPNAVFETINCRGKPLDELDLIRNFLYSHFNDPGEAQRRESVHERLERIPIMLQSSKKASEYMRCRLQCKFGFLRKDHFYRDAREAIQTQKDKRQKRVESPANYAFGITEQICSEAALELFRTMTAATPDEQFVQAFQSTSKTTKKSRNLRVFLRELRTYTVTQPLVFALLFWYVKETDGRKKRKIARLINKNLSRLAAFVLRTAFVAPKFEPSHFETEFSNFARDIERAADVPDVEFADFLQECDRSNYDVLDNDRFREAIVEGRMTGSTKIKQFLLGINGSIQRDASLLNERQCTIEHILPKSSQHWSGWTCFVDDDQQEWVEKIGNLTLMGPNDNKPGAAFNASFAKKCDSFRESGVAITREVAKYPDWSPKAIEERQRTMAKRAVRVWEFS